MKITDFVANKGEFLKAENVTADTKAEIIRESRVEHNEKFDTDRLYIPIKIGDKEYTFDASKTNARTITEVLGDETNDWIGKRIVLETYKLKTKDGKMTTAINVKSVVV